METAVCISKRPVCIVGANGYSGRELARILLSHPGAELKACSTRDPEWRLSKELGDEKALGVSNIKINDLVSSAAHFNAIFLATPAEVSLELAPALIAHTKVIDLSGAFRLPAAEFEEHYQRHAAPEEILTQAEYGLVPWSATPTSPLISNPGCYATSCLMALIPLLQERLIDPRQIVIDAKSGTTGAGRKATEPLLFSEVDGECLPYKVGKHQHLPEIKRYAEFFSGQETDIQFTTHLLPIRRGIISSIYLKRHGNFNSEADDIFLKRIEQAFENAYAKSCLVRYGAIEKNQKLISLRSVVGSPRTHISYAVNANKICVFSCIDNLLKGAASQAIENWNAQNLWPTHTGLKSIEGFL